MTNWKIIDVTFLFGLAISLTPLMRISDSLDSHMVGGWWVLSLTVMLGLFCNIIQLHQNAIWAAMSISVYAIMQSIMGCVLNLEDLFLLLTAVLLLGVRGTFKKEQNAENFKNGIISGLIIQTLVLLIILIKTSLVNGYSHESTYAVQPLFAHRNIAIESSMLWFYWLLQQSENRKRTLWMILLAGGMAFVFQARSAMLMWGIIVAINHKKIFIKKHFSTRIGMIGLAVFCVLQIFIAVLPAEDYKPIFDQLPDNLKALDISYNLNEARSSSDRIELWKWTCENLNLWGHGLGQWRAEAQGEVNERIGRCDLFVRHAHSDFLEYIYELGVIPVALLVSILLFLARDRFPVLLVFLPLLLFSFPTERPEIMVALAFSVIFSKQPEPQPSLQTKTNLKALRNVLTGLVFLGITSWAYSQHLYGRFLAKTTDISRLNVCQQIVLAMYPQDLLNNNLALYQAHYLITHQDVESAIFILEERLRMNPQDLGVQKQLLEIKPNANIVNVYCTQIPKP